MKPKLGELLVQARHIVDDAKACSDGSKCIVFVRVRVPEVDQQAVAKVLCDLPVEALDDLGAGGLVGLHDLVQIFRVEAFGEWRRADQVAEHHCELAPPGI